MLHVPKRRRPAGLRSRDQICIGSGCSECKVAGTPSFAGLHKAGSRPVNDWRRRDTVCFPRSELPANLTADLLHMASGEWQVDVKCQSGILTRVSKGGEGMQSNCLRRLKSSEVGVGRCGE